MADVLPMSALKLSNPVIFSVVTGASIASIGDQRCGASASSVSLRDLPSTLRRSSYSGSVRYGRNAQIAGIPQRRGERVKSTQADLYGLSADYLADCDYGIDPRVSVQSTISLRSANSQLPSCFTN